MTKNPPPGLAESMLINAAALASRPAPEQAPPVRMKLTVAYAGTRYNGWQTQENKNLPTVQDTLEAAFRHILRSSVRVHGAGRTDTGVHADAQTAHVDIPERLARLDWQRILNNFLPDDIAIRDIHPVDSRFHARFNACGKIYTYHLWRDPRFVPPRLAPFMWACPYTLDRGRMEQALPYFLGEHNFSSLRNAGTDVESTVRTITRIGFYDELRLIQDPAALALQIEGNGFLKQMVRNIVGVLAAVGRGKIDPDSVPAILALRDRGSLPAVITAPPGGLVMTRVLYPEQG